MDGCGVGVGVLVVYNEDIVLVLEAKKHPALLELSFSGFAQTIGIA